MRRPEVSRPLYVFSLLFFIGLFYQATPLPVQAQTSKVKEFKLTAPANSREGYFQLLISGVPDEAGFIVEQAADESFTQVMNSYTPVGSFQQLSVSGFDDGVYYFRARLNGSENEYSNIVQVSVSHYSLWQALGLFTLGTVLLLSLLLTLFILHARYGRLTPDHKGD